MHLGDVSAQTWSIVEGLAAVLALVDLGFGDLVLLPQFSADSGVQLVYLFFQHREGMIIILGTQVLGDVIVNIVGDIYLGIGCSGHDEAGIQFRAVFILVGLQGYLANQPILRIVLLHVLIIRRNIGTLLVTIRSNDQPHSDHDCWLHTRFELVPRKGGYWFKAHIIHLICRDLQICESLLAQRLICVNQLICEFHRTDPWMNQPIETTKQQRQKLQQISRLHQTSSNLYKLKNLAQMEQQLLVNPMSLVAMTTYHAKNCPNNLGVSYGLLYALQQQLSYKLTMTAPLGTDKNTVAEIVSRMVEYQTLRLRKGKDNMNYYEEFILIGWYVMGAKKTLDQKVVSELNRSFEQRGCLFSLIYIINKQEASDPSFFKAGNPIKFRFEIDPLQKYCADALNMQASKQESAIVKTLNKQLHLLEIYSEKLDKLSQLLETTKSDEKKRKVLQILDFYERIQFGNKVRKEKTVQAINYSVLTGMILTQTREDK